jgi:hypothetical protein
MAVSIGFTTVTGDTSVFGGNPLTFGEDGIQFTVTFTNSSTAAGIGGGLLSMEVGSIAVPGTHTMTFTDLAGANALTGSVVMDFSFANPNTGNLLKWVTASGSEFTIVDDVALTGRDVTGIKFIFSNNSGFTIFRVKTLTADGLTCFLAGTRIATPCGGKPVEDLLPGDPIRLADGGQTKIKWIGHQRIDTQLVDPVFANPVCITKGALGENVPSRDLYLSGDHAIAIDGMLFNASALINGQSIYRVNEMPQDSFTYYHVETDAHELILAENCQVESYLDANWQATFDNEHARKTTTPIQEMDLPRVSSKRLVPAKTSKLIEERAAQHSAYIGSIKAA